MHAWFPCPCDPCLFPTCTADVHELVTAGTQTAVIGDLVADPPEHNPARRLFTACLGQPVADSEWIKVTKVGVNRDVHAHIFHTYTHSALESV